MAATGVDDEGDFEAHFFCAGAEALGLLDWYERIGVAVVDEHGGQGGCDVIDRGRVVADELPDGHVHCIRPEGLAETDGRSAIARVLGGGAEVE